MAALAINSIGSGYQGELVINQLDLAVEHGDILALLGPSGCGKSTLLRVIAGLHPCLFGAITIQGRVVNSDDIFIASENRGVGLIFQDYALFPHLTIAENILFGVRDASKKSRQAMLTEMLDLIHLQGLEARYPHELSGGQQQRVSIARAIACQPQILLLDEPFSNIDPQVRQELMAQMRAILKSRNITGIFVTHSKEEAFVFADKLAIFEQGAIAQIGTAESLYSFPRSRYVADFLERGNYLPVKVKNAHQVETPLGLLTSDTKLEFANNDSGEMLLRCQNISLIASVGGNGTIIERQFLGRFCHYKVQIDSYELDVKHHNTQLVVGQKVDVTADKHNLIIFEAKCM